MKRDYIKEFDHTDPDYMHSWPVVNEELRAKCPVTHTDAYGGFWVFSKADDVASIFRDPDTFISSKGITIPNIGNPVKAIPTESDGDLHVAYRNILLPWLDSRAVAKREGELRTLTNLVIDEFAAKGECEFIHEFAHPLPARVIAAIMGLPDTDWQFLRDTFYQALITAMSGDMEANAKAWGALTGYLMAQAEDRKQNPKDDLITAFVQAKVGDRDINEDELKSLLFVALTAGQDTTQNTIGNLMHHLAANPAEKQRLLDDPSLIPGAIEESLRWEAPLHTVGRTCARDSLVGGQEIKEGERVAMLVASANRDEDRYDKADEFILDRKVKNHFAFGHGVHLCAGVHLARLEMKIIFEELLRRIPDFELAGEIERILPIGLTYGVAKLPLKFTPEG